MATYEKISDMDAASALVGTEVIEAVQSSASVKATADQLAAFIASDATTLAAILAAIIPTYTTGWVDGGTDWTNREITVTHNLGKNIWDLVIDAWLADDGSGTNAAKLTNASTSTPDFGHSFLSIDTTSFKFHTATNGIIHVIDSGGVAVIDNEQRHYKINAYYLGI